MTDSPRQQPLARHMSQASVARRAEMSATHVHRIESGEEAPRLSSRLALVRAVGPPGVEEVLPPCVNGESAA
jgi:transcriptional regulator with XRE-family HTH domain